MSNKRTFQWAVIGAGPAGIAIVGLLLDSAVPGEQILWVDPTFSGGDFSQHWSAVSSNTKVALFLDFLNGIKSFEYDKCETEFPLMRLNPEGFCELGYVAKPLHWVTEKLRTKVQSVQGMVSNLYTAAGVWNLDCATGVFQAERVVLATGANPRSLKHETVAEIKLPIALNPQLLQSAVTAEDRVAVFGASHSAMIIIKNLLEAGVKEVINFYLTPLRYAIKMNGWTLYDNSGLKGETAKWTRENISKQLNPKVRRYLATPENIQRYLNEANKTVYAIGFQQRVPQTEESIDFTAYDATNGIIAPGLLGAGIGFPRKVTDPNGHAELSVGLWKFMNDIRGMIPLWSEYGL